MNYTVIARRWRPKRFEDVVGQSHIVTTLKNSIKLDRMAHAYLFTGPRGVGKTSLARILAKTVNCIEPKGEEPCGLCENCKAIDNGSFVDIIEIDAASKTGVDDIRELTESVRYLPMKGAYKVYILDESHMLSKSAVSALLKTLEEPPGHNIFVLATTELHKIPYTIMSRCQRFDFRRIAERDLIMQLKRICDFDGITYEEGALEQMALEADGSLRDAESLLEQIIAYSGSHISEKTTIEVIGVVERETLYNIMKTIWEGDLREGIEIVGQILDRGYDVQQIYKGLLSLVRNMLLFKVCDGLPSFLYMGEAEQKRNVELLKNVEYYELQNMLDYLLKSEDLLRGLFPKISLELLYINLYNLSQLRNVEKMIENLGGYHGGGQSGTRPTPKTEEETNRVSPASSTEKKADNLQRPPVEKDGPKVSVPQGSEDRGITTDSVIPQSFTAERPATYHLSGPASRESFLEDLKEKKPFIGNIVASLETKIEEGKLIIFVDKKHRFLRDDSDQKEEIRERLREFFGRDMEIELRESGEIKKSILEEFVKEAETLFKI